MRGWIIVIVFFGGLFALCWYGATGETGPMGWLNSWQVGGSGSYSRTLSFAVVCVAGAVIAAPAVGLWTVVTQKSRGRPGGPSPSITEPADAKIAALRAGMSERSRWRWRTIVTVWLTGVVLAWTVVLTWHGWDFHRRSADAHSAYTPLRLARTATVARPDDGSHLALQGRLLWDRSVTRKPKDGGTDPEVVFVPAAGADWRPGDAVQFVVEFAPSQVWAIQNRADGTDAPLLVRVEGALPTATRPVFQQAEAPPTDAAVLVKVVASHAGQVNETSPTFDWENARLISLVLSGMWTLSLVTAGLAILVQTWKQRRR